MARPRTDIKPRVLAAARARFLAEGVDGASLRDIAKDARTSIGMVFYYFPAKDDLFHAVIEDVYAGIVRDLAAILAPPGSLRARLERASARIGKASPEELDVVRLVAHEALLGTPRFARVFARFDTGHIALVAAALGGGLESGELDATLPLPLLFVATAGMLVLPQLARRLAGDKSVFRGLPDADTLAHAAGGVLFGGVGTLVRAAPSRGAAPRPGRSRRR